MDKVREALEPLARICATHEALFNGNLSANASVLVPMSDLRRASAALASLPASDAGGWRPIESARKAGCICRMCLRDEKDERGYPVTMSRFVTCPTCGNKRCPAASDHRFACTGSNESGQFGSVFGPEIAIRSLPTGGDDA